MATALRKKLSYADFARLPADGRRHEVIDGREVMTPAPNLGHQAVVSKLDRILGHHVEAGRLGHLFVAPTDVLLSRHDIVEPDLVFVCSRNARLLKTKNIQGAPDLVVEVSSPSTAALDRGDKLALYERSGVGEYWIVDLSARTIEIREFRPGRRVRITTEGDVFESVLFPGLKVDVSDVFRAIP